MIDRGNNQHQELTRVFGITGGIGMGKSASAEILRGAGFAVIDTDAIAREIVEPGMPALGEIRSVFGSEFVDGEGRLRRAELARRVFSDPADRARLEQILHPRIRAVWRAEVERWRAEGRSAGFVVIPLLFETGAEAHFDAVICVACSAASQEERLRARGWSVEEIERRNRAQMPIERKMELSRYVVWTESSMEIHSAQLGRILKHEAVPGFEVSRRV